MRGKAPALPTCSPKNSTRLSKTVASCPRHNLSEAHAKTCFPDGLVFCFARASQCRNSGPGLCKPDRSTVL